MNNYHLLFNKTISQLNNKPNLLLHVCCGPCSVYPLKLLAKYFKITIYYSNSNIYPYEEFNKRLHTLYEYLDILNEDIKVVIPSYDQKYQKKLAKYANSKEGMHRCALCYNLRMIESYKYAIKNNFDYFTTIMSISNHKNAHYINRIGHNLEKHFNKKVKFLYADFKKNGGIEQNRLMNKELNLYHQDYCGCIYSLQDFILKK